MSSNVNNPIITNTVSANPSTTVPTTPSTTVPTTPSTTVPTPPSTTVPTPPSTTVPTTPSTTVPIINTKSTTIQNKSTPGKIWGMPKWAFWLLIAGIILIIVVGIILLALYFTGKLGKKPSGTTTSTVSTTSSTSTTVQPSKINTTSTKPPVTQLDTKLKESDVQEITVSNIDLTQNLNSDTMVFFRMPPS